MEVSLSVIDPNDERGLMLRVRVGAVFSGKSWEKTK
jgi:hypothetical protein